MIVFFLLSLLYNKSESVFYHPMIENEIILENDIYISKGHIASIFNVSKSNFTIQNKKTLLLPKGEKIRIVSFIRTNTNNINPNYNLELDTVLNRKILDQLDSNGSTKGYAEGRLYLWSNNFFDALGMLSNAKIDEYSRTSNTLFKILNFLYIFAFLYLILQSLKKYMDIIQTKYSFHPLSLVLYAVAYYYILLASINDGFSSFFLGIPYAIFLLWEIVYLKKENNIKYLHISILLLAIFLLFYDRSQSQLFYPMVGKTYTITKDVNYTHGHFYINKLDIYDTQHSKYLDKKKPVYQLKSDDSFHIKSQMVTGHADMGITYTYEIESEKFSKLYEYISNNLTEIKSQLNKDYERNFNRNKTEFYFNEKKYFYIEDHELQTLLKTQNLPYREHGIETDLTSYSFFILVYPVILGLFFLILTFRNKEIFYEKYKKKTF